MGFSLWFRGQWATFIKNPYRWVWTKIGKRPWTYITRDIYHKIEYIILVGLFTSGYFLGRSELVSAKWFLIIMIAYTIGFIHGHFFWGTNYKENQQGE